jgi:hypothetical protein
MRPILSELGMALLLALEQQMRALAKNSDRCTSRAIPTKMLPSRSTERSPKSEKRYIRGD